MRRISEHADYELRIDPWRVFYRVEAKTVTVELIGEKKGNFLLIGGKEFIAEPGTSWIHPRGVEHFSEALEDCEQLEIKSPPRKTWVTE